MDCKEHSETLGDNFVDAQALLARDQDHPGYKLKISADVKRRHQLVCTSHALTMASPHPHHAAAQANLILLLDAITQPIPSIDIFFVEKGVAPASVLKVTSTESVKSEHAHVDCDNCSLFDPLLEVLMRDVKAVLALHQIQVSRGWGCH